MKNPTDEGLTKLADAAFRKAARKVIARAEESGTPIIVRVNEEVKALEPKAARIGKKRTRLPRRGDNPASNMNG